MAATTAPRNTIQAVPGPIVTRVRVPVKGNTKINQGALVAVDATGYLVPASISTTLKVLGRSHSTYDNTGGADGAIAASVDRGAFKWANATAGDAVVQANLFGTAYAIDDQTVSGTSNGSTRSAAGKIVGIDTDGIWVETT